MLPVAPRDGLCSFVGAGEALFLKPMMKAICTGKTLYYDNGYITIYFVLRSERSDQDFFGVINDYLAFDDIIKL